MKAQIYVRDLTEEEQKTNGSRPVAELGLAGAAGTHLGDWLP
jgi:hypothetical protein